MHGCARKGLARGDLGREWSLLGQGSTSVSTFRSFPPALYPSQAGETVVHQQEPHIPLDGGQRPSASLGMWECFVKRVCSNVTWVGNNEYGWTNQVLKDRPAGEGGSCQESGLRGRVGCGCRKIPPLAHRKGVRLGAGGIDTRAEVLPARPYSLNYGEKKRIAFLVLRKSKGQLFLMFRIC